MALAISVVFILSVATHWTVYTGRTALKQLCIPVALMCVVYLFIVIQCVSVSSDIANPIWSEIEALIGRSVPQTISVNPINTATSLMRLMSYCAVFMLGYVCAQGSQEAWQNIKTFAYMSFVYAAYGIIVYFSGNEWLLWFPKWAYFGDLTSTFTNRNTYATFAGFGVICSLILTLRELAKLNISRVKDLVDMPPKLVVNIYIYSTTLLICMTALFLTHSRGGFMATSIASFIVILTHHLINKRNGFTRLIGGLLFALILFFVLNLSSEITLDRLFNTSFDSENRDEAYRQVIIGIQSAPFLGWGYGTFEEAFRPFYVSNLVGFSWNYAHNTYLEVAFEIGIPAGIIFFSAFVFLGVIFIRGIVQRHRNRLLPVIGLAILVLSAAHAMVDFSNQIPAVAIAFAWLMGTCYAQSWRSNKHKTL